jgi:cation transport ATPase
MPYALFWLLLYLATKFFAKWCKTIFKLKFSNQLLMTIAVVAAFIWENTGSSCRCMLYVLGERWRIGLENSNQH